MHAQLTASHHTRITAKKSMQLYRQQVKPKFQAEVLVTPTRKNLHERPQCNSKK